MPIKKLLYIAKTWPEPNSTAAGRRTLDILSIFQQQNIDIEVACCASMTKHNTDLAELSITCHQINVNCEQFDLLLQQLQPECVIFDRFMTEEQFSWRVKQQLPHCLTLLDTSDLHCLREARREQVNKQATSATT